MIPVEWKDMHAGKRGFVLGTGPSLNSQDLKLLENEITIGCNNIFKVLIPKYLCISDPGVALSVWNKLDCMKGKGEVVISAPPCRSIPNAHTVMLDKSLLVEETGYIHGQLTKTWWGKTVIIDLCLPLAYHLGLSEVYLLGCDCESTGHFYHDQTAGRYADNWVAVFRQYRQMKKLFELAKRKIYNSTAGGKLEIFERVPYERLFDRACSGSAEG